MKKKREFLPPNKTNAINSLFVRTVGRDNVDQWIKRRYYFPPNRTNAFNALFFKNNGRADVDQ